MKKYFILLSSFIIFFSCENKKSEAKNNNDNIEYKPQQIYSGNTSYPSNTSTTQYPNIDYSSPEYISSSNNYQFQNYEIDESIRQLQNESKILYENQMKEINKMKGGLDNYSSSNYEEYKNKKELDAIIAESNRFRNEMNNIQNFKPYERPYIPDPVNLPNSSSNSVDYVNPNANPVKIDVSGYTKSNGTYVEPHIRTVPNDKTTDNLRYSY